MRTTPFLALVLLGGCSQPGGPFPSLQPRAAENLDPRVPVERPVNDRPVTAALASRLASLVSQARAGAVQFDSAASGAERLTASAGPPQSEGWIAAQEALSVALAARRPVAEALGDIDGLGATALQTQGGLAPNDLAAIQTAADEVAAIDRRQSERIDAIQKRLGT